ncbi:hypothetical protein [Flavobacterium caseinilyticum]|uniref:Transmembrane protein n=1 Tax=Flavobacterium caseinilyticum TaxID=2541732 RepID=A0A4R5AU48_9FLAO|nr:hypothetical protein [Flavobacterium caseinilyticum]TDD75540.1 hypothetical protein E0F89_11655 [Flavobacterium caseinilyticum]
MPTTRTPILIAVLFVISFSTIFFIKSSNDHIECDTIPKRELDKNGIEVTTQKHVCKENYSF